MRRIAQAALFGIFLLLSVFSHAKNTGKKVTIDGIDFDVFSLEDSYVGEQLSLEEQDRQNLRPHLRGSRISGIHYNAPENRSRNQIHLQNDGHFHWLTDKLSGKPFPPGQEPQVTSPVMSYAGDILADTQMNMYYQVYVDERFNHASSVGGGDVIFAGSGIFYEGMLEALDYDSGHYRPSLESMVNFLKLLRKRGYVGKKLILFNGGLLSARRMIQLGSEFKWISKPLVEEFRQKYAKYYIDVDEFIANPKLIDINACEREVFAKPFDEQ